jgi:hypothetical protein
LPISIDQGLKFIPAYGVITLKNAHGFMAGSRHDPKVVVSFQATIINEGVPQVVKGKAFYASLFSG